MLVNAGKLGVSLTGEKTKNYGLAPLQTIARKKNGAAP